MRLFRLFCIAALSCASLLAQADETESIARLTKLLTQAQTITGSFSQLSLDGSGVNLQETTGKMALKRPGLMRWHTDPPLEQLLVSNGQKVWLYDPDLDAGDHPES